MNRDTSSSASGEAWRIWDNQLEYGRRLAQRANGELPEMESSKAAAQLVKRIVQPGDRILDVGCGAGHYLKSLQRELDVSFTYTGVDATASYIELARETWQGHEGVNFEVADVFSLPFKTSEFDIVISCNLFHHLPSIAVPLQETVRVASRYILIRTLVGERSFRIKEVYSPATHPDWFPTEGDQDVFDQDGEPKYFHFFNIYSRSYVEGLLSKTPEVERFSIEPDDNFESENISSEVSPDSPPDVTGIIGGWQVTGYILQPWSFTHIVKRSQEPKA